MKLSKEKVEKNIADIENKIKSKRSSLKVAEDNLNKYLKEVNHQKIDCLKLKKNNSHFNLKESIYVHQMIKPKKTIFTHMTALLDEKETLKNVHQIFFLDMMV